MVVAQIVRVRNLARREFSVNTGDPFYTATVDGKVCDDTTFQVPGGADFTTSGFAIPWEIFTRVGLEITSEDMPHQILRVVVGPVDTDPQQRDWLQFRTDTWEKIAQDRWLPLGHRHTLGTVGGNVEIQMTFRDNLQQSFELWEFVHFEFAQCPKSSQDTVYLNVFDLASALSIPNAMLCNTMFNTIGAFHAAVEVYGEEWSFYRTPNPNACGVCKSLRPRHHPVHVYRKSIPLGSTGLKDWEVRYLIRGKLAAKWPGGGYDLLQRNCIHFCDELVLHLGVMPVPNWVRGLHETGASVLRIPWPFSMLNSSSASDADAVNGEEGVADVPAQHTRAPPQRSKTQGDVPSGPPVDPGQAPEDGIFVSVDSSSNLGEHHSIHDRSRTPTPMVLRRKSVP